MTIKIPYNLSRSSSFKDNDTDVPVREYIIIQN